MRSARRRLSTQLDACSAEESRMCVGPPRPGESVCLRCPRPRTGAFQHARQSSSSGPSPVSARARAVVAAGGCRAGPCRPGPAGGADAEAGRSRRRRPPPRPSCRSARAIIDRYIEADRRAEGDPRALVVPRERHDVDAEQRHQPARSRSSARSRTRRSSRSRSAASARCSRGSTARSAGACPR